MRALSVSICRWRVLGCRHSGHMQLSRSQTCEKLVSAPFSPFRQRTPSALVPLHTVVLRRESATIGVFPTDYFIYLLFMRIINK